MVKLRFVTLNLCEVPIIEIPGILQLVIFENDYTATLITHSQILSGFVVGNCSQNIVFGDIFLVALS